MKRYRYNLESNVKTILKETGRKFNFSAFMYFKIEILLCNISIRDIILRKRFLRTCRNILKELIKRSAI